MDTDEEVFKYIISEYILDKTGMRENEGEVMRYGYY